MLPIKKEIKQEPIEDDYCNGGEQEEPIEEWQPTITTTSSMPFTPLVFEQMPIPPYVENPEKPKKSTRKKTVKSSSQNKPLKSPKQSKGPITPGSLLKLCGLAANVTRADIEALFKNFGRLSSISEPRRGKVILRIEGEGKDLAKDFWRRVLKKHRLAPMDNKITFEGRTISAQVLNAEEYDAQLSNNKEKKATRAVAKKEEPVSGKEKQKGASSIHQKKKRAKKEESSEEEEEELEVKPFTPQQRLACIGWRLRPENHKKVEAKFCKQFPDQKPPTEDEVRAWTDIFLQQVATYEPPKEEEDKSGERHKHKRIADEMDESD